MARYIKERMNAEVSYSQENGNINVTLVHSLDKKLYDLPLTLKTHVEPSWEEAKIVQGKSVANVEVLREGASTFVIYQAMPGEESITISRAKLLDM